ncbi:hypothetical protein BCR39DRAFT_521440 [Naematelia encephala]|uniref:Large ribosomal subunit protein bL21m n=1 Tax=Naematelia encephala TaxID=71784 RepID=A0A1Y2BE91_9TREE|nr:hypothetical protein BCR39DRAFT_521440 [Naematelia encephala]
MPGRSPLGAASSLRPLFARSLQTSAPLSPPTQILSSSTFPAAPSSSTSSNSALASSSSSSEPITSPLLSHLPPILPSTTPAPSLPQTTTSALSLLKSQSTSTAGIYILARLHSRTYLLHPRDILSLPTLKPRQPPGSTLALTRILEVGSRDFAVRAPAANASQLRKQLEWWDLQALPTLDQSVVSCELTVLEHTRSPRQDTFKKKRRKGYEKTIRAKHAWTRLRVGDIILGDGEGVKAGEWTGPTTWKDTNHTADTVIGKASET